MIGISVSPLRPKKSGGFTAEALAVFAQMTSLGTAPTAARKVVINNTISALKSAGIWNELDCLYVWAAHSKAAATIDWKNPSTRSASDVGAYAGAFVTDSYVWSNGAFALNLNYNPGDGGTYKFQRDDHSMGIYIKDSNDTTINVVDLSATTSVLNGSELFITTGLATAGVGLSATNRSMSGRLVSGLKSLKRTGASAWRFEQDGYNFYSGTGGHTDASVAVPNLSFRQHCRNIAGALSLVSGKRYCYTFFGSSNFEHFTLSDILNRYYLTPLTINIPKRITFNGNSYTADGTYVGRTIANIATPNSLAINWRGISGQTTVQMQTDAATTIFNKATTAYSKDVYFVWELTNDMFANASNATTCYNNMVTYLQALRAAVGTSAKIIVATMLPRKASEITNANRQNDADLYDDTTLNGKIRNHLVADGYCDAICDVASDAVMGIYSGGVAGVGEKNTTYYNADEVHPNTTGYNRLADNFITASISAYL